LTLQSTGMAIQPSPPTSRQAHLLHAALALTLGAWLWNGVSLFLMTRDSSAAEQVPGVADKLHVVAFQMLEEIQQQENANTTLRPDVTPITRLERVCGIFLSSETSLERALEHMGPLHEFRKAAEWVHKAVAARPKLEAKPNAAETARIEQEWRMAIRHAALDLREAASAVRGIPKGLAVDERSIRLRDRIVSLGVLGLIAAILVILRLRPAPARPLPSAWAPVSWAPLASQVTSDGWIVVGPDSLIKSVNPAAETLLGASGTQVVGRLLRQLTALDPRETNEPVNTTILRDGREIPVLANAHPLRVRGRNGWLLSMRPAVSVEAPATAPRALDRELVAELFQFCPAPLAVLDVRGHLVHWNQACQVLTGLDVSVCRQRPYWEVVLPSPEVNRARREWRSVVSGKADAAVHQTWQATSFNWSRSLIRDDSGQARFVMMIGVANSAVQAARAA